MYRVKPNDAALFVPEAREYARAGVTAAFRQREGSRPTSIACRTIDAGHTESGEVWSVLRYREALPVGSKSQSFNRIA